MKRKTISKDSLPVLRVSTLNILLTLVLCTIFLSCGDQDAPTDPSVLFAAAGDAYRNGDLLACREMLLRVSLLDGENPNVWRNLGTVNLDLGHYNEAVLAYEKVLDLDSTRVDVLTDVTGALVGAGRLSEALHTGELAIQLTPEDGLAFNNYGMALLESGYFEDAAMCFNTAFRREPRNASVLYNCGRITLIAGVPSEALLFFQEATAVDPGFLPSQLETARTLGMLDRHSEAEEHILSVLAITPSDPEALNVLALSYSAQDRQEEAVAVLELILDTNPGDLNARLGLAECQYRLEDSEASLASYQLFMEGLQDTSGTSDIRLRIQELEAARD